MTKCLFYDLAKLFLGFTVYAAYNIHGINVDF